MEGLENGFTALAAAPGPAGNLAEDLERASLAENRVGSG